MERRDLLARLRRHYESSGWTVKKLSDGTLAASGPGGVTWLGTAIMSGDLESPEFEQHLRDLAERRMEDGGELCPLNLVASEDCEPDLHATLERLGLSHRRHVSVYSVAA